MVNNWKLVNIYEDHITQSNQNLLNKHPDLLYSDADTMHYVHQAMH